MELRLSRKTKLKNVKAGALFLHNNTLVLKTEYKSDSGAIEAFIVGSGEMFWGGTTNPLDQYEIEVFELELEPLIASYF